MLFVHGLWLTGAESFLMRRRLARHGLCLRVMPYSSLAESLDTAARRCAQMVAALAARTQKPVHLMGHSLGGHVIFRALQLDLLQADRFSGDFCRAVFLGTPLRGSQSARAIASKAPLRRLLGQSGTRVLTEGLPGRWPFPTQLGVIAGTSPLGMGRLLCKFAGPNDGTVAVSETVAEGARDCCELPVTHTGMVFSPAVADYAAAFLTTGHFPRPDSR